MSEKRSDYLVQVHSVFFFCFSLHVKGIETSKNNMLTVIYLPAVMISLKKQLNLIHRAPQHSHKQTFLGYQFPGEIITVTI